MDFGKTANFAEIDFTLRPEPDFNKIVLPGHSTSKLLFYSGATGWSMPSWKGRVYPAGVKTKDFLYHYSRQFNTIEFNTTHYRIPNEKTITQWYQQSASDFRFCPKMPQQISHRRDLGIESGQLRLFIENISLLEEKLGPVFVQFPPYFGPDSLPALQKLLDQIPVGFRIAIELRHPEWFSGNLALQKIVEKLHQNGHGMVITDVAGRRDVLHMHLSGNFSMIRFVGNSLHHTDYQRIDSWIERIKDWAACGLSEIYFFGHEPDNLLAPELAAYIYGKIREEKTIQTRGPILLDPGNGQISLFD